MTAVRRGGCGGSPSPGLFFLNASHGQLPMTFVQALLAMDYRPVPLSGRPTRRSSTSASSARWTCWSTATRTSSCCSHDADFAPQMEALLGGERRVGVIGLREYASFQYSNLGIQIHDLEDDVQAFKVPLPRVKVIPLDAFDPAYFLR